MRVLAEHSSHRRAEEFESHVTAVLSGKKLSESQTALAGPISSDPRP